MDETDVKPDAGRAAVMRLSLAQMKAGQTGKIVEINGGLGMMRRLDTLGLRIGKEITKVSKQWLSGPVVVRVNHTQAAVGHGIASKVLVEIIDKDGK